MLYLLLYYEAVLGVFGVVLVHVDDGVRVGADDRGRAGVDVGVGCVEAGEQTHGLSLDLLFEHGYSGEEVAGGRHGDAHAPCHAPDAHAPVCRETNGAVGAPPFLTAAT